MSSSQSLFFLFSCLFLVGARSFTFSVPLIHRFSDEARAATKALPGREVGRWPSCRSAEYYDVLVRSDRLRERRRLGRTEYSVLYPSEGSETLSPGNDFGWLHYTWVDVGTPNVSFLVALDAGSDLFWVPCDCIQCAPLSGYRGSMDKELGMYNPDKSKTSKHIFCGHELCSLGGSCRSSNQPCPYIVNYYSENTSTSGWLLEDMLYLVKSEDHVSLQAPVIMGCGRKQSGGYLDGIAPDGLLGLGFGEISVPSMLARVGLIRNSFSICFRSDGSGRLFFGDQGDSTQHTTPFITSDGKYITYIIEVESFCIGDKCPERTNFLVLIDSGSSFTLLPEKVYKKVSLEFDRQINAPRLDYEDSPWEYCYSASSLEMPQVPAIILVFSGNMSFEVSNPIFPVYDKEEYNLAGFCLALQSSTESIGTIGQNFMTDYSMVFDRENFKLGWSRSDCHNLDSSIRVPLTPPPHGRPENPLPTSQQQRSPNARAVSPAIAGRAPITPSTASSQRNNWFCSLFVSILLNWLLSPYIVVFCDVLKCIGYS